MTDEELNRKFEMVAELIANVAVGQQKAEERMVKSDARIDRLERVLKLAIRTYRRDRKETQERINAFIAAQTRMDEAMAKLAESQAHTDERLDALIDIVRRERNGNSNA